MDAFVKEAEQQIADVPLPPGYAEQFLLVAALRDPDLQIAWDNRSNRNVHPMVQSKIRGKLRSAVNKLREAAASVPDADATADRLAIVAHMKGATGKVGPDPPPNYGAMSDAEFSAAKRKLGIFT